MNAIYIWEHNSKTEGDSEFNILWAERSGLLSYSSGEQELDRLFDGHGKKENLRKIYTSQTEESRAEKLRPYKRPIAARTILPTPRVLPSSVAILIC